MHKNGIKVNCVFENDFNTGRGVVRGHNVSQYTLRLLTTFEILQCLYVDDGAFVFETRQDMCKGLQLIHLIFEKYGMEMHVGRNVKPSKTECVYFPPTCTLNLTPIAPSPKSALHSKNVNAVTVANAAT